MADDAAPPLTDESLREEVRAWLAVNWTGALRTEADRKAWAAKVVEARWAAPRWPAEWTGRGLSDAHVDVADGLPWEDAIRRVLDFVGSRPLVGYYIDFDVAMLDKYVRRLIGCPLPNRRVEVSRLYYDWRAPQLPPGSNIDLRFETIRERLNLPRRAEHDAFNDALLAAMMYLRLQPVDKKTPSSLAHSA